MIRIEEEDRAFPPCGYGLLGLCCSDCLSGPCRISPFEKENAKGLCGADADLLVARNLLRLTLREGTRSLKSFREVTLEFRGRIKTPGALLKAAAGVEGKRIARKYGVAADGSEKIISFLKRESAGLLNPFPDEPSSLFSSLFPETVFSHLDREFLPFGSLTGELLDLLEADWKEGAEPEAVLSGCLRASILALIAEEMEQDLLSLLHPPLPIQGSERADKSFSQGLRKEKGNFYLAIQDETALSRLCNYLEEKDS